jgi:putative ABC transport system permease protein
MLIRPLPCTDAARLIQLDGVFTRLPLQVRDSGVELSAPLSAAEVAKVHSFSAAGAYFVTSLNVGNEKPERLRAAAVTAGVFDALAVRPALGRLFTDEDSRARTRVVVIGWRIWRLRFQSDPRVVGRSMDVNSRPFLITGVLPEGVDYPEGSDLWLPYEADPQAAVQVTVPRFVARLAPGATLSNARAEVLAAIRDGALTRQDADVPALRMRTLRDALVGDVRPIFLLVAAAAFLVLAFRG